MILGDSYITFNRRLSNFRGHYVPLESKFRGHLKQKRAKSPFFEGQGKPCTRTFCIFVSYASPIEFSIEVKISFVELGGL